MECFLKKSSSLYLKPTTQKPQPACKDRTPSVKYAPTKLELKGKENIKLVGKSEQRSKGASLKGEKVSTLDLVERKLTQLGIKSSPIDIVSKYGIPLASCKASVDYVYKKQSLALLLDKKNIEDSFKKVKSQRMPQQQARPKQKQLSIAIPTPKAKMTTCQSAKNVGYLALKDKLQVARKGSKQGDVTPSRNVNNFFKERQDSDCKMKKSDSTRVQYASKQHKKSRQRGERSDKIQKYLDEFRFRQTPSSKHQKSISMAKEHPLNQLTISRFRMSKKLGKGRFGQVHLAEDIATSCLLAIKQISKQSILQNDMMGQLQQEIKIQMFSNHPNILKMYGYFADSQNVYLLLELAEGNVFRQLRAEKRFSQTKAAFYLRQVIEALLFLHKQGVIHRDIKPENILRANGTVKLSDFGWSVYSPEHQRKTFCGTLDYVSPDIVLGKTYDSKVDVWSVGVLCYEFCIGRAPFESKQSQDQVYDNILHAKCNFPEWLSEGARQLISKLLIKEPEGRLSLADALQSKWIKEGSRYGYSIDRSVYSEVSSLLS